MKKILIIAFMLLITQAYSQSHRDSIDVLHYNINLDISDISTNQISGYTTVSFVSKYQLSKIHLDLYKLTVDSVHINNLLYSFTQNDSILTINKPIEEANDTLNVNVFYHGHPQQDSRWGGFYFTTDYAYNMGVGMSDYPHPIGRYWYPCIDSFTDKATYEYHIKTANNNKAVCCGLLQNVTIDSTDSKPIYYWSLNQPIPTYLSSVAVGNYIVINDTYSGIKRDIPISIYVVKADSLGATTTFVNLKNMLSAFENRYGAYPWQRIGYVTVPFNGGAMEHATNIAFPTYSLTGSLEDQTLAAHELSHSWFGNLVTCNRSEEMWINEGWASYCEAVFKQDVISEEAYLSHIKKNHKIVILSAHKADGGYYPLNDIPHNISYGRTVYKKGADVCHNLRGYLGDSLFFISSKDYLNHLQFSNASSINLINSFSQSSGVNLNEFFNNWIAQPGFPHYSVDSFVVSSKNKGFTTNVFLSQKLKFREQYSNKNRVPITFMDKQWNRFETTVEFNGQYGQVQVIIPFYPNTVFTDLNYQLNDATIRRSKVLTTTGYSYFNDCDFDINVTEINDSNLINVIYNLVLPSPLSSDIDGVTMSNLHYWKIEGLHNNGFSAGASFSFNRTFNTNPEDGYNFGATDTTVLLYRKNASHNWQVVAKGRKASMAVGDIYLSKIKFGEYAIGYWNGVSNINISSIREKEQNVFKLFPNPSKNIVNMSFINNYTGSVFVYNLNGQLLQQIYLENEDKYVLDTKDLESGMYIIKTDINRQTEELIVKH